VATVKCSGVTMYGIRHEIRLVDNTSEAETINLVSYAIP
jgi:hypothetical protein